MMDNQKNEVKLNRTMTPGQMEMIAIGGTIGGLARDILGSFFI